MNNKSVKITALTMLFVLCLSNAYGQSIDFSVKVATGISAITADLKVEIVEGALTLNADQQWAVVGACTNTPSITIEIVEGAFALNADIKVEIVTGALAIYADKTICIHGANELDIDTLRKLKLVE